MIKTGRGQHFNENYSKKDLSGTDLHYSVCTDRDFDGPLL